MPTDTKQIQQNENNGFIKYYNGLPSELVPGYKVKREKLDKEFTLKQEQKKKNDLKERNAISSAELQIQRWNNGTDPMPKMPRMPQVPEPLMRRYIKVS